MNQKIKKSVISLGVLSCILAATSTNAFAAVARESRASWSGSRA